MAKLVLVLLFGAAVAVFANLGWGQLDATVLEEEDFLPCYQAVLCSLGSEYLEKFAEVLTPEVIKAEQRRFCRRNITDYPDIFDHIKHIKAISHKLDPNDTLQAIENTLEDLRKGDFCGKDVENDILE